MNKNIVSFILSGTLMLSATQGISAQRAPLKSLYSVGSKVMKWLLPFYTDNMEPTGESYRISKEIQKMESVEYDRVKHSNEEIIAPIINKLDEVDSILKSEQPLLKITVDKSQKVYMVGDIHSDLKALNFVLNFINNHPNDKFVFLGDYVDRGICGEEVFLKLAELKVNYPDKIYLLRGNHETKDVNSMYGFKKEIENKYKHTDYNSIYNKFSKVFNKLPVAAVLDCGTKKIFCVHGGICPANDGRTLSLRNIESLLKIEPPTGSVMENLLWSDPIRSDNFSRGAGYIYSSQDVDDFLRKNRLDYIVRAHETVDGIREKFDGTVKSVFSAPHYCGCFENSGAILGFDNTSNSFEVIKFNRSTQPNSNSYIQVN